MPRESIFLFWIFLCGVQPGLQTQDLPPTKELCRKIGGKGNTSLFITDPELWEPKATPPCLRSLGGVEVFVPGFAVLFVLLPSV